MEKQSPSQKDFQFRFSGFKFSEEDGKRTFAGVAYSGGSIKHPHWINVAFDLSTTEASEKLPILLSHDDDKRLGYSTSLSISDDIKVEGELISNDYAKRVGDDADDGFPWQMSVNILPSTIEKVSEDQVVLVNGREFSDGHVFRNNNITEISFTPTGYDHTTAAFVFNNNGDITVADTKTVEAGESLKVENIQLRVDKQTLENEVKELKFSLEKLQESQRTDEVNTLFSQLGMEITEDDKKFYLGMDVLTFSAVKANLLKAKPKPITNPDLFAEIATGGADDQHTKFSVADSVKEQVGITS